MKTKGAQKSDWGRGAEDDERREDKKTRCFWSKSAQTIENEGPKGGKEHKER